MAPLAMKRKAVTKIAEAAAAAVSKRSKDLEVEDQDAEDEEMPEVPRKSEKEVEKETAAAREKELKGMSAADLKQLAEVKGISAGNKADITKAILKNEATERAHERQREAQVRHVVLKKKEDLEAMSVTDLKDVCTEMGVKSSSKAERIEQVLARWLQEDGVNKALAKIAHDKREVELCAMDKLALQKLCEKAGVDAFVKDVLVERMIKHEVDAGKFKKPTLAPVQTTEKASAQPSKTDMVEALLAQKREDEEAAERRAKEAAAVQTKIKELKAKSLDELKKLLKKKGLEPTGKKEEMIEALYGVISEEDAVAARKDELKGMEKDALAVVVKARGLEPSASKDKMVSALLVHEAQIVQEMKGYKVKVVEASKIKEEALSKKTGAQLKDMCVAKNVAVGGSNEDKVKRLVEVAQGDGEVDAIIFKMARETRTKELQGLEKTQLVKLAVSVGVDALVKEVMVERILCHEEERGEPVAKKARK